MKKFEGFRKERQGCRHRISDGAPLVPAGAIPPPATPPTEGAAALAPAPAPATP
ncbi:MAG: hypothetical protein KBG15_05270 [Kofleriaceae bacterium]|nr:hypothetical protein [Kofleriaceae bacterium]